MIEKCRAQNYKCRECSRKCDDAVSYLHENIMHRQNISNAKNMARNLLLNYRGKIQRRVGMHNLQKSIVV